MKLRMLFVLLLSVVVLPNIVGAPIDEVPPFDRPGQETEDQDSGDEGSEDQESDESEEEESEDQEDGQAEEGEDETDGDESDGADGETAETDGEPATPVRTGDSVELVSIPADEAVRPKPVNIRRVLQIVDIEELPNLLETDRRLLSEIRKEVPENRREAEVYLHRLRDLAAASDPMRLVPLANRVLDNSTIYFDWLNTEYENQDERIMEYYVGGARGFSFALDNFRNAVLYTIINRLDLSARIITALQAIGTTE